MSLPQTYKHAVFKSAGADLEIEEVNLKLPSKGELLVKVEACGVCYSDCFAQNNVMGGGFPIVPGHEIIGRVVALGDNVMGWAIGDRVGAGWHGGHDGTCGPCKQGWPHMCDNQAVNGETRNGGYGEYCLLRAEAAASVPSTVDAAKYAPIMCAGMTVFNALRNMHLPTGATVAVKGLGGLGHLAVQYARKMGYRVVAISRGGAGGDKEAFVRGLGAHEYIDAAAATGGVGAALRKIGGAALIITTAPTADGMADLLGGLGVFGKLLILSVPGDITVNTGAMLKYGLSIQSWPCGNARDTEETVQFTQLQGIDCMIETFPLARADDAFKAMLNGSVRFRAVITMD
ncbi:chaperonin 10-like protein [Cercophora scortea]|uniref:Chaperonin 10-like protein n=1 Tax=Cercophora scortea TaxID=314031 RepID=A0AAE0M6N5_9PEZI|nr:chaperonin 10-like protein [Cercophora scortea]